MSFRQSLSRNLVVVTEKIPAAGMTLDGSFLVFAPHFIPYVEMTLNKINDYGGNLIARLENQPEFSADGRVLNCSVKHP